MLHILLYNYTTGKWRIIPLCFCVSRIFKISLFKPLFCKKYKRRSTNTLLEKKCGSIFRSLQTNKFSNNRYRIVWKILLTDGDPLYKAIFDIDPHYHYVSELTVIFYNKINKETGSLLSFFFPEERRHKAQFYRNDYFGW